MEQDLEAVLSFCNDVRAQLGRKPVEQLRKGKRCDAGRCPIANTINFHSQTRYNTCSCCGVWQPESDGSKVLTGLSALAIAFIRAFDDGDLPQFEGTGWAA